MQAIPLPNKVYFQKEEGNSSVLVIEPLYPGYGVTIGNALRRVLLSSLVGASVVAFKIKGINHEFSTVPGVREDVVDIMLALKRLRLKVHADGPVTLSLKAKGPKEITAGDIEKNSDVEIINSDLPIATIDEKGKELNMEIIVNQGRGYVPVEMREEEKLEIGMIAVDALYSPVRSVNFDVENVRVGQMTNYDKLTLTIETDGTVSGQEALDQAAGVLVDHFSLLLTEVVDNVADQEEKAEDSTAALGDLSSEEEASAAEPLQTEDLHELDLSNRSLNALQRNNIRTMSELKQLTREELLSLDGLGEKSANEILEKLQ